MFLAEHYNMTKANSIPTFCLHRFDILTSVTKVGGAPAHVHHMRSALVVDVHKETKDGGREKSGERRSGGRV